MSRGSPPFPRDVTATWVHYLAHQSPVVIEALMALLVEHGRDQPDLADLVQRTEDIYVPDLASARRFLGEGS